MLVPDAVVLHPATYMRGLWEACRQRSVSRATCLAETAGPLRNSWHFSKSRAESTGCRLRLVPAAVSSIAHDLPAAAAAPGSREQDKFPYDAVVVSTGAATGAIHELSGLLPLQLCHGLTVEARPRSGDPSGSLLYPEEAPSILGPYYLAAHSREDVTVRQGAGSDGS